MVTTVCNDGFFDEGADEDCDEICNTTKMSGALVLTKDTDIPTVRAACKSTQQSLDCIRRHWGDKCRAIYKYGRALRHEICRDVAATVRHSICLHEFTDERCLNRSHNELETWYRLDVSEGASYSIDKRMCCIIKVPCFNAGAIRACGEEAIHFEENLRLTLFERSFRFRCNDFLEDCNRKLSTAPAALRQQKQQDNLYGIIGALLLALLNVLSAQRIA